MTKIRQAVVLCAGNGARMKPFTNYYPKCLLPIKSKIALEVILEELLQSGIKKIVFVINKNQWIIKRVVQDFLSRCNKRVLCVYVVQKIKNGGGGALLLCEKYLNNMPFLLLFSDDICQSKTTASRQVIRTFEKTKKNVMAIRRVAPSNAHNYGIISYSKKQKNIFYPLNIIEKPKTPLQTNYANFGRYAFYPQIFMVLKNILQEQNGEIYLTHALEKLMNENFLVAKKIIGNAYDIGTPQNYIKTFKKYKTK